MTTIAQVIADFAAGPVLRSNPEPSERMVPYALDTLAVILAGSVAPSSQSIIRTVLSACGKAEASVAGEGRVTSAWDAAFANGALAHALELDDDHRIAVLHPGAVVVPAALAASEAANASGPDFLRALLVGYEVMCRTGEVFRGSQFPHGVHPTSLCGVFGAAAAAGVVMNLDREAFVRALGIAGTQACGLTEWRADGSWIKRLHPGRAAQTGVMSARLASHGFTGPATIFEGEGGFFNAFSYGETIDPSRMTDGLGRKFSAFGTAIKPYPCCRFEHGALDLAILASQQGITASSVAEIRVRIYATGVLTYHREPRNVVDAQFNLPYGVAVALSHGQVQLSDFTETAIRDPEVLALCRKVRVIEDPEFSASYPEEYRVELAIDRVDGTEKTYFSKCPNGDPEAEQYQGKPGKFLDDVHQKTRSLLAECGFEERSNRLIAAVEDLPGARDLSALCEAFVRSGPGPSQNNTTGSQTQTFTQPDSVSRSPAATEGSIP